MGNNFSDVLNQQTNLINNIDPPKESNKDNTPAIDTREVLQEAQQELYAKSDVTEKDYIQYDDTNKIKLIERELVSTIKEIDMNIEAVSIYERNIKTKHFPKAIYEIKNVLLDSKRKTLKELFDIIAHQQKLNKEKAGDSFTDIIS